MNQDFGLALTPANARRLLRFQQTCNLVLPDELLTLAKRGTLGEDAFDPFVYPYELARLTITQFLHDCNLRGIVQQNYHPEFTELAVINAIRISKPETITISTHRPDAWRNAIRAFFLHDKTKFVRQFELSSADIDERRSGVLIVDNDGQTDGMRLRDFGNEFARTIVFDQQKDWSMLTPWPVIAQAMFPTMPVPLYPRIVKNISKAYDKPLHMFAPLYNVCLFPELIDSNSIEERLTDKYLHFRMQHYRNMMIIG